MFKSKFRYFFLLQFMKQVTNSLKCQRKLLFEKMIKLWKSNKLNSLTVDSELSSISDNIDRVMCKLVNTKKMLKNCQAKTR